MGPVPSPNHPGNLRVPPTYFLTPGSCCGPYSQWIHPVYSQGPVTPFPAALGLVGRAGLALGLCGVLGGALPCGGSLRGPVLCSACGVAAIASCLSPSPWRRKGSGLGLRTPDFSLFLLGPSAPLLFDLYILFFFLMVQQAGEDATWVLLCCCPESRFFFFFVIVVLLFPFYPRSSEISFGPRERGSYPPTPCTTVFCFVFWLWFLFFFLLPTDFYFFFQHLLEIPQAGE